MIDTRQKRTSSIGCRRLPWFRRFAQPAPHFNTSKADRSQLAYVYPLASATLNAIWSHPVLSKAINALRIDGDNARILATAAMPRIELDGDTDIDPQIGNERIEVEG